MLSYDTRVAILTLHSKNAGIRAIARALKISRAAVQRVIEQGTADVPALARAEQLSTEKFNRFWCKVFLVDAIHYFEGKLRRRVADARRLSP